MTTFKNLIPLVLAATLTALPGCVTDGLKNEKTAGADNPAQDSLDIFLEKFRNRTVYDRLTAELIDTTPDMELVPVVFDNLLLKVPEDYTKEQEAVLSWTKPQQAVYILWNLDAEVNNGGFNQYYFNTEGKFAGMVPAAFQLVGAPSFAALAERANRIYNAEYKKITQHQDGTLEGFSKSYKDNPLNEVDDAYYELEKKEDLQQKLTAFIRKHKQDFIN